MSARGYADGCPRAGQLNVVTQLDGLVLEGDISLRSTIDQYGKAFQL